ncbi:competence protein ComGC [Ureibacillus xyleni]|uniref:ComG operon protein 3 n=1 Tax=Ureibacillus xyleni TaxID=614648 RepID=A0A285TTH0_9BACL|nr:competence type IV pilus major pilin ComGC [Ureibacillus xyleni]SOC27368.1 competence protein ComGC [Ureibacillus xyleni]
MIRNSKGFTLIEMLIVLLIISVLILVTIPNVTKHFATIDEKGCDAYVNMVQGQVEAYKIEHKKFPTSIDQLVEEKYLKENETTCPNGELVNIQEDGSVVVNNKENVSDGT